MEIGGVFVLEYIDYIKEVFDVFHFILAHDILFLVMMYFHFY